MPNNSSSEVVHSDDQTVFPETIEISGGAPHKRRIASETWCEDLGHWLGSKSSYPLDAFIMLTTNQMSQMLLLLPSCAAQLGWWRATVATVIFGLMSCWTAHLVQVFYFQYFRSPEHDNDDEIVQWDELLYYSFDNQGILKHFWIFGLVFNCLCLLARSTIQLTYAVRVWTCVLASCCIFFAFFPTFRNYRTSSILSFAIATAAAICITTAALLHEPFQGVKHSAESHSIWSFAWVSCIIVYAFGDTSAAVETLVTIERGDNKRWFKYAFCASTVYTLFFSLLAALTSYWVFGDELAKISPAAQPCALAVLRPSRLRDIASILLLILELVAIGHSLYPLFMSLKRVKCLTRYRNEYYTVACASIVGLIGISAAAIPFSGSMEITALVGSLVISLAIYIIPTAAHMLYFGYSQNRQDAELWGFPLMAYYMINLIVFAGVIVVVLVGGVRTSINKVFLSHRFHLSDFWNKCYLCAADLQLSPAFPPIGAPAPNHS